MDYLGMIRQPNNQQPKPSSVRPGLVIQWDSPLLGRCYGTVIEICAAHILITDHSVLTAKANVLPEWVVEVSKQ